MYNIIDNKAQLDEERWIVTLSRTMRNFPRSHSIRANSADRESWFFLNKALEQGRQSGLKAAASRATADYAMSERSSRELPDEGWVLPDASSPSTPSTPAHETIKARSRETLGTPESRTPGTELASMLGSTKDQGPGKLEMLKKGIICDSIPPLGAQMVSCWPRTQHGHPPEYTVPADMAEKALKPLVDQARQEIIRMGFRPGPDLLSPGEHLLEDFSALEHISELGTWRNDAIWRNNEWTKKPPGVKAAPKASFSSIHGFERTHHTEKASPPAGSARSASTRSRSRRLS